MHKPTSRLSHPENESGAAAVEFALVLTILVLLLFGILEFGREWSKVEVLESAAREGARVAAVRGDAAAIQDAVQVAAGPYAPDITGAISVSPGPCTEETVGQTVTVAWTQSFPSFNLPLLPDLTIPDRPIAGVFRCE